MDEWVKDAKTVWLVLGVVAQAAVTYWQTKHHAELLEDHEKRLRALENTVAGRGVRLDAQEKRLDHHQALLDGMK